MEAKFTWSPICQFGATWICKSKSAALDTGFKNLSPASVLHKLRSKIEWILWGDGPVLMIQSCWYPGDQISCFPFNALYISSGESIIGTWTLVARVGVVLSPFPSNFTSRVLFALEIDCMLTFTAVACSVFDESLFALCDYLHHFEILNMKVCSHQVLKQGVLVLNK